MRTNLLSGVRNRTENKSSDSTTPVTPLVSMVSPIFTVRSAIKKIPLIILDTLVLAAKPIAIPATPAAPRSAAMLILNCCNIVITIMARQT